MKLATSQALRCHHLTADQGMHQCEAGIDGPRRPAAFQQQHGARPAVALIAAHLGSRAAGEPEKLQQILVEWSRRDFDRVAVDGNESGQ